MSEEEKLNSEDAQMNEDKHYTVWVGGVEVNDYLLNKEEAQYLADQYSEDGYDDVQVEEV